MVLKNLKILQDTDAKLVKQCLQGDRKSQQELYGLYASEMFRICLRYASTRVDAEDMLQEGFVRIYRDLNQYNGDGPLGGWMYRVMVRSALQYLRKQASKPRYFEELGSIRDHGYGEDMAGKLDAEILTREISRLPEGYRIVFNLYVIEGYKHEEIADMLEISVNTSKSQLHKAKARLRSRLESLLYTRA